MNKKVVMDDRASVNLIMPTFVAILALGCTKKILD